MDDSSRRQLLGATGAALGTLLAGCATGGDGTTGTTRGTEPTTETQTTATQEPTTETQTTTTQEPTTETQTTTEETTTTREQTATADATAETTTARTTTEGPAAVVTVGPGGELVFEPSSVTLSAGDTVEWRWDSSGHNVVVDAQPEDGGWTGTEGGSSTTYDTGHTYSFTFDVAGTYDYYCAPHRSFGMRGTIVVE